MPLDPCAQSADEFPDLADWQRSTRRSGPGATAATKLVRLGHGPPAFNHPPVGRRWSSSPSLSGVARALLCCMCVRTCR
ncbi:hypothetical protein M441DRAFT_58080 [Trichoderma asperellum CBS 433.97]|uniref:Uncharacterized protein n=1 Tax=Trichoderma asperellum (strain ATCC 204424 / CBS 433.97 / NBRC 101777) TaxID=1042311 RepID=A0A2T3Z6Z8_TRIA4|nr:hypothetical protein M441DRAFT_58080 [Trichoderma asperellum CBS 433.97]PTB40579.1 hypothetical protein M441DRAFT_58080 [Trichoderma asperellum CBS 433.97]